MTSSIQPNQTLYINNLNDKINKEELRSQLYALFMTYGRVIDVVAKKGNKMKGQAFLAFSDLAEATAAMRACEGMIFYDKPLHIHYAKSKSYAVSRQEDPDFIPPNPVGAGSMSRQQNGSEKRLRDDADGVNSSRQVKREKPSEDDDDDMEMELDDDEDASDSQKKPVPAAPTSKQQPTSRLLCTNIPLETTDDALAALFRQYKGFLQTHVAASPTPSPTGERCKIAQVFYESPDLASAARNALDGFTLKKDWQITVSYI